MRRNKDGGGAVVYTDELGRSLVTARVLQSLKNEGKLENLVKARVPGMETVPVPWDKEAVVFVAYFDAGLRFPCVDLVADALRLYQVELGQLTPNSLVKLGVFEWELRFVRRAERGAFSLTCTTGDAN